jgi:HEAT repeat protein
MRTSVELGTAVCDRRNLLRLAGGALLGKTALGLGLTGSVAVTTLLVEAMPIYAQAEKKEIKKKRSSEKINGKTMTEWMDALKDKDVSTRERAIAALKAYEEEARDVAPAIIRAINDKDMSLRVNAIITLGFIGMDEKDRPAGVNALKQHLVTPEHQGIVRFQAARALGRIGKDAYDAVPQLIVATRDQYCWEIRAAAVSALGNAGWSPNGGFDSNSFNALVESTRDTCLEVRVQALLALITFGTPAAPAQHTKLTNALVACTREREPKRVQIWARVALMRIQPPGANAAQKFMDTQLKDICKHLKDRDLETRVNAARAIAAVGPIAKKRVPDLIDALQDRESEMLVWTCIALSVMEDAAAPAYAELKRLEQFPDPAVQNAAKSALLKIGNKAAGR